MKQIIGRFVLSLMLLNLGSAFAQGRIHFNHQQLFLNGANFAWVSFARDIGPGTTNFARFDQIFRDVSANGGNAMRLWLHTTGAASPQFDANGFVIGPGAGTIEDLKQILDLAWQHRVGVTPCLWSFDMLRTSNGAGITDRAMSMLSDTTYLRAYINNSLIPMVQALRGHPAIIAWEIFNEPEGMSNEFGWDFNRHVPMSYIQRFVNLCAGAIHRTDPQAQVTNGAWSFLALTDVPTTSMPKSFEWSETQKHEVERVFELKYGARLTAEEIVRHMQRAETMGFNYYSDNRLIASGGDVNGTLDFYSVHYWNWMQQSISSFHHNASYWNLDKPIVVGEFGMIETFSPVNVPTAERFNRLYANGYAGALAWSWTDTQLSTAAQMLAGMLDIKTRYPNDVTITFPSGTINSFAANPAVIEKGQASTLTWATVAGSVVTLDGNLVTENDSVQVTPSLTTTYKLVAIGAVRDSNEVTVEVLLPGTIVSFIANPTRVAVGEASTLSWHAVAGSSVTLNGVAVAAEDSLQVYPTHDSTFVLIATGEAADTSAITINVLDALDINRALNRTATASSNEPNSPVGNPALAVDGNLQTRWSSAWMDNQHITVDLGQRYDIHRVVLYWEVAYGRMYRLQVSDDQTNWTDIYSTTTSDGGTDDIANLFGAGRYVRMWGMVRATQWGFSLWEFEVFGLPSTVGVEEQQFTPLTFMLEQNHPNPFNPETEIKYRLPADAHVTLEVFNLLGSKVATLINFKQTRGAYKVAFNAQGLSSGIYFYRLAAGKQRQVKRMVLVE